LSANEFNKIADSFIEIFDAVSTEVEKEKISAIGARNLLHTASKQREAQLQQITALVMMPYLQPEINCLTIAIFNYSFVKSKLNMIGWHVSSHPSRKWRQLS